MGIPLRIFTWAFFSSFFLVVSPHFSYYDQISRWSHHVSWSTLWWSICWWWMSWQSSGMSRIRWRFLPGGPRAKSPSAILSHFFTTMLPLLFYCWAIFPQPSNVHHVLHRPCFSLDYTKNRHKGHKSIKAFIDKLGGNIVSTCRNSMTSFSELLFSFGVELLRSSKVLLEASGLVGEPVES